MTNFFFLIFIILITVGEKIILNIVSKRKKKNVTKNITLKRRFIIHALRVFYYENKPLSQCQGNTVFSIRGKLKLILLNFAAKINNNY